MLLLVQTSHFPQALVCNASESTSRVWHRAINSPPCFSPPPFWSLPQHFSLPTAVFWKTLTAFTRPSSSLSPHLQGGSERSCRQCCEAHETLQLCSSKPRGRREAGRFSFGCEPSLHAEPSHSAKIASYKSQQCHSESHCWYSTFSK